MTVNFRFKELHICILLFFVLSCGQEKTKRTKIEVSSKIANMGEISIGAEKKAKFIIKNIGENDLFISDIIPDCYCTIPLWNKKAVSPGDSTSVAVTVKKEQEGIFQQVVKVQMNTNEKSLLLVVRGKFVKL
jgi:hypothetical protein